jgi:hypothetical protein
MICHDNRWTGWQEILCRTRGAPRVADWQTDAQREIPARTHVPQSSSSAEFLQNQILTIFIMPVLTTHPGVYIEEIPSGVHTITRRHIHRGVHRLGAKGSDRSHNQQENKIICQHET